MGLIYEYTCHCVYIYIRILRYIYIYIYLFIYLFIYLLFIYLELDLYKYIDNWTGKKNLILVTHYVVILETLDKAVSSGEIVISDKTIDQFESNLLRRICGLIYVPDKISAEIKLKLLNTK